MPIFEFQCGKCQDTEEEIFHGNPPDFVSCGCGGKKRRILSAFNGPDQMQCMTRAMGGQRFVKRRSEWREKIDEGRVEAPPV